MTTDGASLEFHVLGPLTVTRDGARLDLGPARQRAVLALLLMSPNEVVSVDRLIDQLWAGEPPASATGTLQAYVSNLRRALEPHREQRRPPSVLVTEAPGYVVRVERAALDVARFEDLLSEARSAMDAADHRAALTLVERALACWTGPALADFEHDDFTVAWRARVDELRAFADELRIELLILTGRAAHAAAELEELIVRWPVRERLRAHQVRALALAGRQADALRAYDRARRYLGDELGIDPGPELVEIYQRVLNQDPVLFAPPTPAPAPVTTVEPAAPPVAGRNRPFLGRAGVVERILGRSRPGFVVVTGEAGIGKTRVVEEVAERAAAAGHAVAIGRCHDDEGAPPLWPWQQVLRTLGLAAALDTVDASGATSQDVFGRFERARVALQTLARSQPVVVVLDDVQWADLTSLRMLSFLATELRDDPVLVVLTLRDTDVVAGTPVADTLARLARAGALSVPLLGLGREAVADLVRHAAGLAVDDRAVDELLARTGGNPFYLGEVARLWASRGEAHGVPELVGDVVRARLARLPEPTRRALALAAVLGRSFGVQVLAQAGGVDIDDVLEAIDSALAIRLLADDGAGRLRFAHAIVAETLLDDAGPARVGRYHVRAADALEALAPTDPTISAAEIARHLDRAVEMVGAPFVARAFASAQAAAREASDGGAFLDAARWWQTALHHGRQLGISTVEEVSLLSNLTLAKLDAGDFFGPEGAMEIQRDAIKLARTLPAPARAAALTEPAAVAFTRPRTWQWRPPGRSDAVVIEALEFAIAALPEDDIARRVQATASLAVELLSRPDGPPRAAALSAEAVRLARRLDDVEVLARALLARVLTLDVPGQRAAQLETVEELLSLPLQERFKLLRALSLTWRLGLRIALGEGPIGDEPLGVELRSLTKRLHDPIVTITRGWAGVTLAFFRADWQLAHTRALDTWRRQRALGEYGATLVFVMHEARRLMESSRLPPTPADVAPEPLTEEELASLDLAELYWAGVTGTDPAVVEELIDLHAPRVLVWRGAEWLMWMAHLVRAACTAGSPWLPRLYDELAPYAGEVSLRWPYPVYGAVDHHLGLAARHLGRIETSISHFDAAIRLHDRIGALSWALRSRLDRADSLGLGDAGARREAIEVLDRIDPDLHRLGFTDLHERSTRLRAQLSG